jgi:D-alanyl-D-alanine carboxypeptidase
MSHTEFYNASGLPDPRQVTTARDLARLARALYRDFPGQYRNFATQEFMFRGVVYTNHNHLMERFAGMDGIKTGYIRASGFNLAASAVRNNQRLIGVVMGGESSRARDDKMAALLNAGFEQSAEDPIAALADATDAAEARSFSERAGHALRHLSPVSSAEAAVPQVRKPARASRSGQTDGDAWGIQVGAFSQRAGATRAAEEALAALPWAKGKTIAVAAPSAAEKSRLYRARIVGFTAKDADRACQTLHRKRAACAVVGPGTLSVAQR